MNSSKTKNLMIIVTVLIVFAMTCTSSAQPPRPRGPRVVSPEVTADRHVTFCILAPKAEEVLLSGSDIPGVGRGAAMTKDPNGVWEVTLGPIESGAYRYNFNVDGVSVIDPRNPSTSESNKIAPPCSTPPPITTICGFMKFTKKAAFMPKISPPRCKRLIAKLSLELAASNMVLKLILFRSLFTK